MFTSYTLYYAPDNASLCVRLALLELGLPFETVLVDRKANGQTHPAYVALNPNAVIPTLITDEGPIYETGAILLWLADRSPSGFVPSGMSRAEALKWMFWLANTLHPALRMWFYPDKFIAAEAVPALRETTRRRLAELFAHIEAHAAWLDAPTPSALSCYLAPMVRWSALYGSDQAWFDLSNYPRLKAYVQSIECGPHVLTAAMSEGLGDKPFSDPSYPQPPEGSAL